jgi:hypothetical protein
MQNSPEKINPAEQEAKFRLARQKHRDEALKLEEALKRDKDNEPKCSRCGRKGHTVKTCITPKKPTDKE